MKLVLVDDDGEMLDFVHCHLDEFSYAQEDGGAATLLLGSLLPFSYYDNDGDIGMIEVYLQNKRGEQKLFTDDAVPADIMIPPEIGKIRISE